jgi:hypothetical protein
MSVSQALGTAMTAARFCRGFDENRNFLRSRSHRLHRFPPIIADFIVCRGLTALSVLTAACWRKC